MAYTDVLNALLLELRTKLEVQAATTGSDLKIDAATLESLAAVQTAIGNTATTGGSATDAATIASGIDTSTMAIDTLATLLKRLEAIRWATDYSGLSARQHQSGFTRPANTTPYVAGDAVWGSTTSAFVLVGAFSNWNVPDNDTTGTIHSLTIQSSAAVPGDLHLAIADREVNSAADNSPALTWARPPIAVIQIPAADWVPVGGGVAQTIQVSVPFEPIPSSLNLRAQLITGEAMTLASAQTFNILTGVSWNYSDRYRSSYGAGVTTWTPDGWI